MAAFCVFCNRCYRSSGLVQPSHRGLDDIFRRCHSTCSLSGEMWSAFGRTEFALEFFGTTGCNRAKAGCLKNLGLGGQSEISLLDGRYDE